VSVDVVGVTPGRPGDPPGLFAATQPRFRAIGSGANRHGLRLEKIFWDTLDFLAARRQQKRTALIAGLLDGMHENAASRLRCYCLMEIEEERKRLADGASRTQSIRLMQQAPVPAFSITRQKRLEEVNREFMQFLRVAAGTASDAVSPERVHLSLDTPVDQLFVKLASPPFAAFCGYSIRVEAKRRQGRVKVVPVPGEPVEGLVGYIIS
jgi:predicted DNA-binding ribbon-helix-helix protein